MKIKDLKGIEDMLTSGEISANGYESISGYEVPFLWQSLGDLELL